MVKSQSKAAVQAALDRSGLGLQVTRLSEGARSVRDAARAIGCEPEAIVKSLVFHGEESGKANLAEVCGAHRVSLDLLAQAAGERLVMASPDFALSQTGFPVGLRNRIEVFSMRRC